MMGDLPDQVGKGVQRLFRLDEHGIWTVDVSHPVQDRLPGDDERLGGGLQRQAVPGAVPQDGQALPRLKVGSAIGLDLEQTGPEEIVLGAQAIEALAEREDLGRLGMTERGQAQGDAPADPTCDQEENTVHGERSSLPGRRATVSFQER
jgi:hypothetical protein